MKASTSSRTYRALAALEGQPAGLLTPEIARMLDEYPWGLVEIARVLRTHEARGRVGRTQPEHGVTVRWKITERGSRYLAEIDASEPVAIGAEEIARLRDHIDADHGIMVQLGRIADTAVKMLEHVNMDTDEDRELHGRATRALRGRLDELAATLDSPQDSR